MCKFATPWTDDEGRYDCYLCIKDWTQCDGICGEHKEIETKALEIIKAKGGRNGIR